ncbi:hypothetical protein VZG28_05245 [Synechococcus elongatus IITB4]|uniref:hypothetical protein n=1 Tax=Synechococcus elongatus TaxID=32046 RepID=UPI0030D3F6BD
MAFYKYEIDTASGRRYRGLVRKRIAEGLYLNLHDPDRVWLFFWDEDGIGVAIAKTEILSLFCKPMDLGEPSKPDVRKLDDRELAERAYGVRPQERGESEFLGDFSIADTAGNRPVTEEDKSNAGIPEWAAVTSDEDCWCGGKLGPEEGSVWKSMETGRGYTVRGVGKMIETGEYHVLFDPIGEDNGSKKTWPLAGWTERFVEVET